MPARSTTQIAPHRQAPDDLRQQVYSGQTLSGRVLLDAASFERCWFRGAVLVYGGGEPPSIADCAFDDVSFEFVGPAGRTLELLRAMAAPKSGLREVFKASFPSLFGH